MIVIVRLIQKDLRLIRRQVFFDLKSDFARKNLFAGPKKKMPRKIQHGNPILVKDALTSESRRNPIESIAINVV